MRRHQLLPSLLILLCLSLSSHAQQASQSTDANATAVSYGFVSPNTEENLSLPQAMKKLQSAEENQLISETRNVACRARFKPLVMRSIGSWSDGAENSTLFKTNTDTLAIRYAVASLGKYARQKAVLFFRQEEGGNARLYILYPRQRDLFAISRTLDRAGIAFRTLVPLKPRTLVYLVDLNNELGQKVPTAARLLKARVRTVRGSGSFIGDDANRDKAQSIYTTEITAFENMRPPPRDCARLQK